jgi:hypothetical protein
MLSQKRRTTRHFFSRDGNNRKDRKTVSAPRRRRARDKRAGEDHQPRAGSALFLIKSPDRGSGTGVRLSRDEGAGSGRYSGPKVVRPRGGQRGMASGPRPQTSRPGCPCSHPATSESRTWELL